MTVKVFSCAKKRYLTVKSIKIRGGHRVMFLENHYRTPGSEGLSNV